MNKFSQEIEKKKAQIELLEKEIEDLRKKEEESQLKELRSLARKSGKSIDDLIDMLKEQNS